MSLLPNKMCNKKHKKEVNDILKQNSELSELALKMLLFVDWLIFWLLPIRFCSYWL